MFHLCVLDILFPPREEAYLFSMPNTVGHLQEVSADHSSLSPVISHLLSLLFLPPLVSLPSEEISALVDKEKMRPELERLQGGSSTTSHILKGL